MMQEISSDNIVKTLLLNFSQNFSTSSFVFDSLMCWAIDSSYLNLSLSQSLIFVRIRRSCSLSANAIFLASIVLRLETVDTSRGDDSFVVMITSVWRLVEIPIGSNMSFQYYQISICAKIRYGNIWGEYTFIVF